MDFRTCCLWFIHVILLAGLACGLQITTTGPTSIEKASGESVKLDCQFTLAPEDTGPMDIEWTLQPSDNQEVEKPVIVYSGDRVYSEYYAPLIGRVYFNSPDPKNGDASMNIMGLKAIDTGTYQCKVKKVPGINSRKFLLTVMVRPSKPRCYADGPTLMGKDMMLRCNSADGTQPLKYTWERITGNKLLPPTAVLDPVGGTMSLRNATESASGTYRCVAKNNVGTEECAVEVSVVPAPNTAGIIAGAVISVLLALILLALILFCCCRARQKKRYEKEISYEIREDVPPPKSRVSTARSFTSVGSQRSSLGSMSPSNLHEYTKPQYDKIPSEENDRPPSHAPIPPPSRMAGPNLSRMAGPNLSRMGAIPVMIPAQNRDGSIV
ncbi:coxsackievirus and adenovirus receptor homolog [Triplophysa dalaica]|uniref:coxsackievirus and adenovirus receptor homolog n=1 Tax=Triplophysa dalaica TaxID=1582913 RepID=UPI0024E02513|nr:coxsackievirus and adenovirus receptor homolog [Triplophysa dalaica]